MLGGVDREIDVIAGQVRRRFRLRRARTLARKQHGHRRSPDDQRPGKSNPIPHETPVERMRVCEGDSVEAAATREEFWIEQARGLSRSPRSPVSWGGGCGDIGDIAHIRPPTPALLCGSSAAPFLTSFGPVRRPPAGESLGSRMPTGNSPSSGTSTGRPCLMGNRTAQRPQTSCWSSRDKLASRSGSRGQRSKDRKVSSIVSGLWSLVIGHRSS